MYIIKCDTQGMDAQILSRLPKKVWHNCQAAIIEVWAISEVTKEDVENLLFMCQEFGYVSWQPEFGKRIEFNEVSKFWLSKSGEKKNLFLRKAT